jgi:hypothetical protein
VTLDKRIEMMTGLTVESAEFLQIARYGIGGHYGPHWDFSRVTGNVIHLQKTANNFSARRKSRWSARYFCCWKREPHCYSALLRKFVQRCVNLYLRYIRTVSVKNSISKFSWLKIYCRAYLEFRSWQNAAKKMVFVYLKSEFTARLARTWRCHNIPSDENRRERKQSKSNMRKVQKNKNDWLTFL